MWTPQRKNTNSWNFYSFRNIVRDRSRWDTLYSMYCYNIILLSWKTLFLTKSTYQWSWILTTGEKAVKSSITCFPGLFWHPQISWNPEKNYPVYYTIVTVVAKPTKPLLSILCNKKPEWHWKKSKTDTDKQCWVKKVEIHLLNLIV